MKTTLILEDIRIGHAPDMFHRRQMVQPDTRRAVLKNRAWVALLSWSHCLQREFLDGYNDYFHSNEDGTRGIYKCFFLDDGIYEVSAPTGWYEVDRYFCHVINGELEKINRVEVIRCLKKD